MRRDLCAGTVSLRGIVLDGGICANHVGSERFLQAAVILRLVFASFCVSVERLGSWVLHWSNQSFVVTLGVRDEPVAPSLVCPEIASHGISNTIIVPIPE